MHVWQIWQAPVAGKNEKHVRPAAKVALAHSCTSKPDSPPWPFRSRDAAHNMFPPMRCARTGITGGEDCGVGGDGGMRGDAGNGGVRGEKGDCGLQYITTFVHVVLPVRPVVLPARWPP